MQTYQKRPHSGNNASKSPVAQAAETGDFNYQPTQADMGSRVDLPEMMRAKMENAFGMDFSGVQLYQSQAVADAGANAITVGNQIAFAPGKLDFISQSGQALLGHELSHVASQERGEVTGQGFLNDGLLEARADREGALAAAGQQVYTGPVVPLSGSTAMSMSGPMQAKKKKKKEKAAEPEPAVQQEEPKTIPVSQPVHSESKTVAKPVPKALPEKYDYATDLENMTAWLNGAGKEEEAKKTEREKLLTSQNYLYDSVSTEGGKESVGSIYFDEAQSNENLKGKERWNGRIRLLHFDGPELDIRNGNTKHVTRQDKRTQKDHLLEYEEINKDVYDHLRNLSGFQPHRDENGKYWKMFHPSRGVGKEKTKGLNLENQDYEKLSEVVRYAQHLSKGDLTGLTGEAWKKAAARNILHGNLFLQRYMQENEKFKDIPLDESAFREAFVKKKTSFGAEEQNIIDQYRKREDEKQL